MRLAPPRRRPLPVTLTSLIDVVCVLLIFFMLATTFTRWTTMPLDLSAQPAPSGAAVPGIASVAADGAGAMLIRIGAGGAVDLNGEPFGAAAFDAEIAAALAADPGQLFLVRPGAGVVLQEVVDLLERLERLGVSRAALVEG